MHLLKVTLSREDEDFDFFWCTIEWMKDNFDHKFLPDHVRLCHFRNHFEVVIVLPY